MPAPTPTPPLRYVSHRRLSSPLASATSDATRSIAAADNVSGGAHGHFAPTAGPQLGASAKLFYTNTLSSSEGFVDQRPRAAERGEDERLGLGYHGSMTGRRANTTPLLHPTHTDGYVTSPPPPFDSPPIGSLSNSGEAPAVGGGSSSSHSRSRPANPPPTCSIEDCHATVHALQHENAILRQRIEVLTSFDVAAAADQDGSVADTAEVSRAVLLRRIARLEAALRLEALERDVVEQRLLAQERVLRAVCTPVPPPTTAPTAAAGAGAAET